MIQFVMRAIIFQLAEQEDGHLGGGEHPLVTPLLRRLKGVMVGSSHEEGGYIQISCYGNESFQHGTYRRFNSGQWTGLYLNLTIHKKQEGQNRFGS